MLGRVKPVWAGFVGWFGPPWRRWIDPRAKRFWAVVFLLAYTLAGFFLVPWAAKRQIIASLESAYERPAQLDELYVNPFLFSVDARGFALTETDGTPLLAFDRFYARLRLASVFRWAWSFAAVELEGAHAEVVRFADARTNWGRMLATAASEGEEEHEAQEEEGGPARLIIGKLALSDASARFIDHTRPSTFETDVGPITVSAEGVSTLPRTEGEQEVAIGFEDGGRLAWSGSLSLNPLMSAGTVSASGPYAPLLYRYFQDDVGFEVSTGSIELGLDYRVDAPPEVEPTATIANASVALRDLTMLMEGEEDPAVRLPELRLAGGRLAWPEQRAGADSLSVDNLELVFWRTEDGALSTDLMMASASAAADAPPSEPAPATPSDPTGGWALALGRLDVTGLKARFDDRAVRQPGAVQITALDLTAQDVSNVPEARSPFTLMANLAPGGELRLEGEAAILPTPVLEATLTGTDVQIAAAQPYVADIARVSIEDGRLSVEGDMALSPEGAVTTAGALELTSLKVIDQDQGERLLEAGRLAVGRYELALAEQELEVSDISLEAPYARLQVNQDSSTNLQQLLVSADAEPGAEGAAEENADADDQGGVSEPEAPTDAWRIAVGSIDVTGGAADFADFSLPFPFASEITDFEGEITTLDSASADPARLSLQGQVGDYGLAQADGQLRPFDPVEQTDVRLLFRNIAIPDLSPYTIKFAGRSIASGRMDLDLNYAVDAGEMAGENNIVITEIELGETVDQPGAMNLPLGLAIALLKNGEGVIDVDIPVRGDVTDPEFRFGGVIGRAIANLITGIVTSPFRMLGGLVGLDSDDFGRIEFEAGHADLTPPEREKLVKLAEALALRPNLTVQAPGVSDAAVDGAAMQELRVDARVRERIESLGEGRDGEALLTELRREVLEGLFAERFPDEPLAALQAEHTRPPADAEDAPEGAGELDVPAYLTAMRQRLIEAELITEADVAELAAQRAMAVVAALTEEDGVDPARVSTLPAQSAEATDQGWVPLALQVGSAG